MFDWLGDLWDWAATGVGDAWDWASGGLEDAWDWATDWDDEFANMSDFGEFGEIGGGGAPTGEFAGFDLADPGFSQFNAADAGNPVTTDLPNWPAYDPSLDIDWGSDEAALIAAPLPPLDYRDPNNPNWSPLGMSDPENLMGTADPTSMIGSTGAGTPGGAAVSPFGAPQDPLTPTPLGPTNQQPTQPTQIPKPGSGGGSASGGAGRALAIDMPETPTVEGAAVPSMPGMQPIPAAPGIDAPQSPAPIAPPAAQTVAPPPEPTLPAPPQVLAFNPATFGGGGSAGAGGEGALLHMLQQVLGGPPADPFARTRRALAAMMGGR